MEEIHWLTINEVNGLLSRRELSAVDVLDATLERIEQTEPIVNAYVALMSGSARADAQRADRELNEGRCRSPLHGVPIALKDVICTRSFPTEAGSRVLAGFVPKSDAKVVQRLRQAGAVLIGKTVTHEFAYGQNLPPTRNAWDQGRYPGGSSAGAAVAVAVGSAYGAIGTDTGGSVRIPAALNGIVGLKPTQGRVSREGIIPLSTSLDTVGPLGRTVEDCAHLLQAVAGGTDDDASALLHPVPNYRGRVGIGVEGLRIGVERNHFLHDGVAADVRGAVQTALQQLAASGADVVHVEVEEIEHAVPAAWSLVLAEASEWHRELLRERASDYDPHTRALLERGSTLPAVTYIRAQRARRRVREGFRRTFERHALDVLIAPSVPSTAVAIAEVAHEIATGEPGVMSASFHHSVVANLVGVPALSVPCGFDARGLPIGLQIIGRPFAEDVLFQVGHAYESANRWRTCRPL